MQEKKHLRDKVKIQNCCIKVENWLLLILQSFYICIFNNYLLGIFLNPLNEWFTLQRYVPAQWGNKYSGSTMFVTIGSFKTEKEKNVVKI